MPYTIIDGIEDYTDASEVLATSEMLFDAAMVAAPPPYLQKKWQEIQVAIVVDAGFSIGRDKLASIPLIRAGGPCVPTDDSNCTITIGMADPDAYQKTGKDRKDYYYAQFNLYAAANEVIALSESKYDSEQGQLLNQ